MDSRGLRAPAVLLQLEKNACQSCVAAQAFYMFGLINEPDMASIDREIGRTPREAADGFEMNYLWLRSGFRINHIGPWDIGQFLREGVSYARRFYGEQWDHEFEAFFTDEWVRECRQKDAALQRKYPGLESRKQVTLRLPVIQDIRDALMPPHTLVLAVFTSGGFTTHEVLVYGVDNDVFLVYYPCKYEEAIFRTVSFEEFAECWWLPEEGISIIFQ